MARQPRKRPDHHVGVRKIRVMVAEEKRSRRGHDMIVMRLSIEGWMGYLIREYLVFTDTAFWRIEQFLASIGKEVADGEVISADDLWRVTGYAKVGVSIHENPRKKNYFIVKWLPQKSQPGPATAPEAPTDGGAA